MTQKPRFVLFAHNATYDKLHQLATLGMTAAAMGKDVIVVLLFWTIKKLAEGRIDEVDFPPEYASAAGEVARLLKEKKVPKISDMFADARLWHIQAGGLGTSGTWVWKSKRSRHGWMP